MSWPRDVNLKGELGPDADPKVRDLVCQYDDGLYTYRELVVVLVALAIELPPATIVQGLPAQVVENLKASVEHLPEGPEQLVIIKYPTWKVGIDAREAADRYDRDTYTALLRMHRHFW